jgi:hypothetical protein
MGNRGHKIFDLIARFLIFVFILIIPLNFLIQYDCRITINSIFQNLLLYFILLIGLFEGLMICFFDICIPKQQDPKREDIVRIFNSNAPSDLKI